MKEGNRILSFLVSGGMMLLPCGGAFALGTPESAKAGAGVPFGEFNALRTRGMDAPPVSALETARRAAAAPAHQRGLAVRDVPAPAAPPKETGGRSWSGRAKEILGEAAGLAGYLSGIPMEIGVQAGATLAAGAEGRQIIAMAGVRGPMASVGIIGGWPGGVLAGIAIAVKAAPLLGAAVWAAAGLIGGMIAGYSTVQRIRSLAR